MGVTGCACLGDEGGCGDGVARTWAMAQLRVSWRESGRAVSGAAWRGAGPGTTRHGRDDGRGRGSGASTAQYNTMRFRPMAHSSGFSED
uniref:Uncharacterized protein n=1 Tax=Oryza glumipatula TaxID=40148 RepID=A0A0E0AU16_9ORYZ